MRVEKRNMSNLIKREEKEGKEREGGEEKEGKGRERGRGKRERKKCKRRSVKELVPRLGNEANPCYSKVGDG